MRFVVLLYFSLRFLVTHDLPDFILDLIDTLLDGREVTLLEASISLHFFLSLFFCVELLAILS